jgi:hypothetical protein
MRPVSEVHLRELEQGRRPEMSEVRLALPGGKDDQAQRHHLVVSQPGMRLRGSGRAGRAARGRRRIAERVVFLESEAARKNFSDFREKNLARPALISQFASADSHRPMF